MFKYLKLLIIGVVITLLIGCPKKEREMFIIGGAFIEEYSESKSEWLEVNIFSDPLIDDAKVTVNGITLEKIEWVSPLYPYGLWYRNTTSTLAYGATYNLSIDCEIGKAEASATMPGGFTIDAPEQIFINSPLAVSWTKASNADFYVVDLWYWDFEGDEDVDTSIVTTDLELIFSGKLFPHYGKISLYVKAINGPVPKPDSQGNVKGDGFGFWIAELCKHVEIDVESSKAKSHLLPKKKRERREEPIIRTLKLYAPYNQKVREILSGLKRR